MEILILAACAAVAVTINAIVIRPLARICF